MHDVPVSVPQERRSPLYVLADVLVREALGVPLSAWMLEERTRVDRRSWSRMALQLATLTQGRVSTTTVTLRSWFNADQELRSTREGVAQDDGSRLERFGAGEK